MKKVILLTANVKLESIYLLQTFIEKKDEVIILSTNKMFPYEREQIEKYFYVSKYETFAENLSDSDMEACDLRAFYDIQEVYPLKYENLPAYYSLIKKYKNELVREKIKQKYGEIYTIICADDLGIDMSVWAKDNFQKICLDYYYDKDDETISQKGFIQNAKQKLKRWKILVNIVHYFKPQMTREVYEAEHEGKKYVFIGSLNKIGYRMQLEWKESPKEFKRIARGKYNTSDNCQYLSTLHECFHCNIPDTPSYDVRYIQDGYLPPNYSSQYLKFKPDNVKYYAWDLSGTKIFNYQEVPVSLMPFRKKLYLPKPVFAKKIKKILVVTSGAGDWTALKNRSDEDLMVEAFAKIAERFADIEFVYRCHPVWVHPKHQGMNSIVRVSEYFKSLGLDNIKVSTNIIKEDLTTFKVSLPRQSMDEDLKGTDLVFGEHSIAMVDGAFKGIPFASVNLTGRRDLFKGLTDLGFPHFEKIVDVISFIENLPHSVDQQRAYQEAVENYNRMTDEEE